MARKKAPVPADPKPLSAIELRKLQHGARHVAEVYGIDLAYRLTRWARRSVLGAGRS